MGRAPELASKGRTAFSERITVPCRVVDSVLRTRRCRAEGKTNRDIHAWPALPARQFYGLDGLEAQPHPD
jgi:hypothetical protein